MSKQFDVAVIDYGMGNLHSVNKALQHVADKASIYVGDDVDVIARAERIVYPGVGAIRDCVGEIKRRGLDQLIVELSNTKPMLAICVGMQGLMAFSEENEGVDCLGVFPDRVRYFGDNLTDSAGTKLKVPHMGWNKVAQTVAHPLWRDIENDARFYFVHSYYVAAKQASCIAGQTQYGVELAAAVARDNIFAVQFHPEKSHKDGLQLLKNFMRWDGSI